MKRKHSTDSLASNAMGPPSPKRLKIEITRKTSSSSSSSSSSHKAARRKRKNAVSGRADRKIVSLIKETRRRLQREPCLKSRLVLVSKRTYHEHDYVLLMLKKPKNSRTTSSSSLASGSQGGAKSRRRRRDGSIRDPKPPHVPGRERLLRVYTSLKQTAWIEQDLEDRGSEANYRDALSRICDEKIRPEQLDWCANWILKRAIMEPDTCLIEYVARCPLVRIAPISSSRETTAVHLAASRQRQSGIPTRLVELLLERSDPRHNYADSRTGLTHLHVAASTGNVRLIGAYLDAGVDPNLWGPCEYGPGTPLHSAVRGLRWRAVKLLLSRGADPTLTDEWDKTPLHYACAQIARPVGQDQEDDCKLRILGELLGHRSRGEQLEARDRHGNTALHALLASDCLGRLHHYTLAMLLALGCRVDAANANGSTALHQVVKIPRFNRHLYLGDDCSVGMAGYLLSRGADPNALDLRCRSPMQLACSRLNFWAIDSLQRAGVADDWADFRLEPRAIENRPYLDHCFNVLDLTELARARGHEMADWQQLRVLESLLSPARFVAGWRDKMSCVLQLGSERQIRAHLDERLRQIELLADRDPPTRSYLAARLLEALFVPVSLHAFGLGTSESLYRYLVGLFNRLQSGPDRRDFGRDDIVALSTEMDYTRNVPLGAGRRLHELLSLSPDRIGNNAVRWLDHPCAQEVLRKRLFYNMYPRAGGYIEAHVAKCLVRRYATSCGLRFVGRLARARPSSLPDLVCREILARLDNEDIMNVCRATLDVV